MFIGREKELANLRSIAALLSDHRGAVVRLHGELGIGKTALIQEYTQGYHQRDEVIICRCLDSVFSDEMTPIFDFAQDRGVDIASLIDRNADVTVLFAALLKFFMSREAATVIVIEDAQWAKGRMLSFLTYIGRRIVFSRCMLIISYRTSDVNPEHVLNHALTRVPDNLIHDINLTGLPPCTVNQLSCSGKALGDLSQITGGNPLFATQLNFLGLQWSEKSGVVDDVIRRRVDRLEERERELLEALSVIPYPITEALMRKLDRGGSSLGSLIDVHKGFLVADVDGCYVFQHELLRKLVIEQVSEIRQVDFHTQIFKAYGELDIALNLVWKLFHAHGAGLAEEVIDFALRLSIDCSNVSAHSEAAAYLSIAMNYAYSADNETAAILYESWAKEACFADEVTEKVFDCRQHAINLWRGLGRDDKVGENLYSLSRSHWFSGNPAQAQILADQAIRVLENARVSNHTAKAYSLRSQLCLLQNEHAEAISFGQRALELEEITQSNEVRVHALNNIGTAMMLTGNSAGHELLQQSLNLALKHELHEHISRAYCNLACCAFHTKELETAERVVVQGIKYGTIYENHSKSSYLSGIAAQICAERGKLVDAETIASGLLESCEKTSILLMPAHNTLARVFSLRGNPEAEHNLQQALSKSLVIGEPQYVITARFNLVEYAWINEKIELAAEQIRKLTEVEPSKLDCWRQAELDCWVSRFGFDIQSSGIDHSALPYRLELDGQYLRASKAWAELGVPLNQAICLILSATSSSGNGLLDAYKICKSNSAIGLINKVRTEADRLGLYKVVPKKLRGNNKATQQHPLGLTKKEQNVLEKILAGKSNAEISGELSRSTRTIENHVSSILRKFNAKNRLEVILRAQNEPWMNRAGNTTSTAARM